MVDHHADPRTEAVSVEQFGFLSSARVQVTLCQLDSQHQRRAFQPLYTRSQGLRQTQARRQFGVQWPLRDLGISAALIASQGRRSAPRPRPRSSASLFLIYHARDPSTVALSSVPSSSCPPPTTVLFTAPQAPTPHPTRRSLSLTPCPHPTRAPPRLRSPQPPPARRRARRSHSLAPAGRNQLSRRLVAPRSSSPRASRPPLAGTLASGCTSPATSGEPPLPLRADGL